MKIHTANSHSKKAASLLKKLVLGGLLGVMTSSSASALTIRVDKPTRNYENYGKWSRFDGSCTIFRGNNNNHGIASCVCFDSRWVVLARHTLRNVENYKNNTGDRVRIRARGWESALSAYTPNRNVRIEQITYYDDDFTSFTNTIDIGVAGSPFTIQPIRMAVLSSAWDEPGRVGSSASGANNRSDGNGVSRKTENSNTSNSRDPNSVRWAGKNIIDTRTGFGVISNTIASILKYDFDSPSNTSSNRSGSATAQALENGTAGGDSGSPVYIEKNGIPNLIAGVLSGGTGSGYGAEATYPRIRGYRNWILDVLADSSL